jgi:Concanavalin A-like lectin/glucanases superfamily/Secretion system C-terminal sorting domain
MIKNYLKIIVAVVFATNVMAQNIPSYVPKDGLVGWWPFNGNANDESGNGNHGTVNGATLAADRNGKANNAYNFDGIDDGIEINNSVFSNNNSLSYTINFWCMLKTKVLTNNGYTIFDDCDSLQWFGKGRFVVNSNYFKNSNFHFREDKNIAKDTIIINTWINYTCVLNTKKAKLYLYTNSKLIDSAIYNSNYYKSGNRKLQIGRCQSPGKYNSINFFTSHWNGLIDDISIYNRALSDQEVKQLYEGCTKETATSSNFNSVIYTTNTPLNLTATPSGGTFSGEAVTNNTFEPSKAKLGKNQVKYNFKNSTGCADSTNFEMILVDTLGNKCSTYDTLKIKIQLTTGIKARQLASMNVYPNPTSDVLIIEAIDVAALNGYSYKMVDLQGKQVYKELVTKSKTEISLKNIGAKGVYILHVLDAQGVSIENKKIVLE